MDKLAFGFPESAVATVAAEGAQLAYSTSWAVGGDTSSVDNVIATADAQNTTPVIHWYYWGDNISRACVDNWSDTSVCKDGRTRQKWEAGATTLADKIHQYRPGRQTVVTLELEFHKKDVGDYENLDGYLERQATLLKKYPGEVTVVLGWGEWATDTTYNRFDRAQAASHWAGTQILYSCINQTLAKYRGAVSEVIANAATIKTRFGKPLFVYDFATSSYSEGMSGDPAYRSWDANYQCKEDSPLSNGYAGEQNNVLAEIFSRKQELKNSDVAGLIFRALEDHASREIYDDDGVTFKDYHKIAERWFGFRHEGVKKPAWNTVMNGIKAENGSTTTPPPPAANEWRQEAESFPTKTTGAQCARADASGGLCWNIWSNGSISTTTSSLTAGTKTVSVAAHGDPAGGVWPIMEMRVDGVLVKTASVTDDIWLTFSHTMSLAAGTHVIQVSYTNDGSVDGNDRNLLVDWASVSGASLTRSWLTEAESFTTKTDGGDITSSGASGGHYWNLWSNGYIETAMTAPSTGTHDVEVIARGDVAAGIWPQMKVYVDGTLVLTQTVATTTWTAYRVPRTLSAGSHVLRIEFTNDGVVGTEDRNLKLDYAALYS